MKTDADVAGKVRHILMDQLGVDEDAVCAAARLNEDLGADSLDQIEIVMAAEAEFGIDIPDQDAAPMATVAQLITYVLERLARPDRGAAL